MKPTHVAFSDDSACPDDRYKSLSLVSLRKKYLGDFREKLNEKLDEANISSEFKWSKLRNKRYKRAADKFIKFVFKNEKKLRIDTIIWDLKDDRHEVFGRDDKENLARMYYHLVSNTFGRRWSVKDTSWSWFPDEQSSVDWDLLREFIESKRRGSNMELFNEESNFEQVDFEKITPSDSEERPLIQVADLFAGIAVFSRGRFQKYIKWSREDAKTDLFFNTDEVSLSNSDEKRFKVIKTLNRKCKNRNLRVAFKSEGGFYSHDPNAFLNFWFYEPQGDYDSAPTRD